ncbi:AMP-binding protein [Xenorhabdus sp. XENO-10]|uniref:AMP-binding protein n=1 Tax=Xenorhabdus yunnanensis TaxID=3025878 RepID=A0ABT5LAJ4_9GAMM|nr:AMP-binding protein [Xenorhabdus yunnanensis]MDC9588047.1 AMP-binding protein [Xenorhabdus yunnanensis]
MSLETYTKFKNIVKKNQSINLAKKFVIENKFLDKPCFIGPDGSLSYSQLAFFVKKSASAMKLKKIEKNTIVILCLNDSRELAIIFFSCLAIGALPIIINPKLPANTFNYILSEFKNPFIFIDEDNQIPIESKVNISFIRIKKTANLSTFSDWMPKGTDDKWNEFLEKSAFEPTFIQYTSGSTGKPKGVIHSATSILTSCENFAKRQLALSTTDIIYSTPKTFFGYGMGGTLFFSLYLGATAIIDSLWPSATRVANNIKLFKPTVLFSGPIIFRLLLEDNELKQNCHLRLVISSGSTLSESLKKDWLNQFNIAIHDAFGATETCHVFATTYGYPLRSGSIGKLITGCVGLISDKDGKELPIGKTGVLMLRSESLASGYWNNDKNTKFKFSKGWYHTGDLFSQDEEGFLYYHGREDDQFKVFGRWLVPVEMEKLINVAFPKAGDIFIIPWLDSSHECRPILCLKITPNEFEIVSQQIANFISQQVESYKHPYAYFNVEQFPLNGNGKIDRKSLIEMAQKKITDKNISSIPRIINYENS